MYNINFYEALSELDKLNSDQLVEDTIEDLAYPPEIQKLIDQGAVVLADEPEFIKDELDGITESIQWSEHGIRTHMGSPAFGGYHVAAGKQNLWVLENRDGGTHGYQFSSLVRRLPNGGADWYKQQAENLINAEVDDNNVRCFICQDTAKTNGAGSATKKYTDTGEARRNLNTTFRICKYRKNPALRIPAENMYYNNLDTGEEGPKPTKDFVFADHNIYETVYYTYSNSYSTMSDKTVNRQTDIRILSYFLKPLQEIEADIASAEHVFNTSQDKSRTMTRYSNQIDIVKAAKTASAQIVCFVLSFEPAWNAIKVSLYNNPTKAQNAYAEDSSAFLVGLYNGNSIQSLRGKETPENRDRANAWISYANMYNEDYTTERIKRVVNRYNDLAQPGVLLKTLPKATEDEVRQVVADGIWAIEKKVVASGKPVVTLYKKSEDELVNGLLGSANVFT